ncbi:MAG: type IV-A pilus assembly ATPase PilB [bacterium]|nr:type IV-A pilus assembly ATPase PilB [bacterium]
MAEVSLKDRLVQVLVRSKLVTEEHLEEAKRIQKETGGQIGRILIEQGFVDSDDLMMSLSDHLGIPPINLSKVKIPEEVAGMISKQLAMFYQVVPISKVGNTLTVAMADPLNVFALDDLRLMTGMEIQPVISNPKDVEDKLDEIYSAKHGLDSILKDTAVPTIEITKEGDDEQEIDVEKLLQATGDTSVIQVVNILLVQAVGEGASDIHIEPFEKDMRVRYRLDGILHERTSPPRSMHSAIVSRIKIMSNLDIAERRRPQDGRFRIKFKGRDIDFRVSVLPTAHGEKVVMRILDKSASSRKLDDLGFDPKALAKFKEAIHAPYGMVLVTGPTGSGKTTTLYAALTEINKTEINIITVEDPIEYQIKGINQVQVNAEIDLTFATGLRSILRQDPNVVLVGEIRDQETADIAIKAALTGHLVFSTLHTNNAPSAVTRLDDMGVEPFLISSSVILVMAQRLVRRICEGCKRPLDVDPVTLQRCQYVADLRRPASFCHGVGCNRCGGSGYKGRMSVIELFLMEDELRSLVVKRASATEIKKVAIQHGMHTMRMNALQKAAEGVTTLEEVLRETAPDET